MAAIGVKTFYPSAPASSDPSALQLLNSKNDLNPQISSDRDTDQSATFEKSQKQLSDRDVYQIKPKEKVDETNPVGTPKPAVGPLVLEAGNFGVTLAGKTQTIYEQINLFQGTTDPVGLATLGFASAFTVMSGACTTYDGYQEQRSAKKIGDVCGRAFGGLKTLRGSITATAAAISLPARALALAMLKTTSQVVAVAAGALTTVAEGLFGMVGLIYFVIFSLKIYEQMGFDRELDAILNDSSLGQEEKQGKVLEFLQGKLSVSDAEKGAVRSEVEATPRYQQLSSQEKEGKIEKKTAKLFKKKEEELKRVLSRKCVDQIRKAEKVDAAAVVDAALAASRTNRIVNGIGMTLCVLGITATVIAFLFTGPLPLLIAVVLAGIVTVGLFSSDLYQLFQDFQRSQPGRYDKLALLFAGVLAFTVASAMVFLAASWIALTCAGVFGLVWLTISLVCYWRLRQLEKAQLLPQKSPDQTSVRIPPRRVSGEEIFYLKKRLSNSAYDGFWGSIRGRTLNAFGYTIAVEDFDGERSYVDLTRLTQKLLKPDLGYPIASDVAAQMPDVQKLVLENLQPEPEREITWYKVGALFQEFRSPERVAQFRGRDFPSVRKAAVESLQSFRVTA